MMNERESKAKENLEKFYYTALGIPEIMIDREKSDWGEYIEKLVHIVDYEILESRYYKDKHGKPNYYAVLTLKEAPGKYFHAGKAVVDKLSLFDEGGMHEDFRVASGVPAIFSINEFEIPGEEKKVQYVNIKLFPKDQ